MIARKSRLTAAHWWYLYQPLLHHSQTNERGFVTMLDSMDSNLDRVIKWANVSPLGCGRELESFTLDKRHVCDVVLANILEVVGHLVTIAMFRSAVPACDSLAVVKHLEEIGSIWWMRSVDRVLKPI